MSRHQQKRRNSPLRSLMAIALLLSGAVALPGCSDSGKQAAAPTAIAGKPQAAVVSKVSATQEEEQKFVYTYDPTGKRDPFAPLITRDEKRARSGDRPPLERFNVHDFKLSGIIWGGFGYNAMLEGPDGKGYFVHVGTIIGLNRGVVKKITSNALIIEEIFSTVTGSTDRKEIIIEIRKPQQEGMQ